jgi:hypothetical protein
MGLSNIISSNNIQYTSLRISEERVNTALVHLEIWAKAKTKLFIDLSKCKKAKSARTKNL